MRMNGSSKQPNSEIKEFIRSTYRSVTDLRSSVEQIPLDGITIEQFWEKEDSISIVGYTDSNKVVAEYLRQIQQRVGDPHPHLDFFRREDREEKEKKPVSAFSITIDEYTDSNSQKEIQIAAHPSPRTTIYNCWFTAHYPGQMPASY